MAQRVPLPASLPIFAPPSIPAWEYKTAIDRLLPMASIFLPVEDRTRLIKSLAFLCKHWHRVDPGHISIMEEVLLYGKYHTSIVARTQQDRKVWMLVLGDGKTERYMAIVGLKDAVERMREDVESRGLGYVSDAAGGGDGGMPGVLDRRRDGDEAEAKSEVEIKSEGDDSIDWPELHCS